MNRDFPKQCSSRGTDQERKHCNEKSRREWSKGVHKEHAGGEERRKGGALSSEAATIGHGSRPHHG